MAMRHGDGNYMTEVHAEEGRQMSLSPLQVAGERRGKLLAVLDRLQHIVDTGATTVMFTPLTASGPGVRLST